MKKGKKPADPIDPAEVLALVQEYDELIEKQIDGALNGEPASIAVVRNGLRKWALGETDFLPEERLLRVAALHFLGSEALLPVPRAEEFELPIQLDAANIAYQAVRNDADGGDKTAPFQERIKLFLSKNWPKGTFSAAALNRIGTVANVDTTTGPKRKRSAK